MTTEIAKYSPASIMEQVIIKGDLSALQPMERVTYYNALCESVGVNQLSRPFEYIELNGKLVLYAVRNCTDQLRNNRSINVTIMAREKHDDVYVVTARATMPDGRTDESIGAVPISKEDGSWETASSGKRYFKGNGQFRPLHGDELANALMKAETKAKRRVTLSIVGLSLLDETEVETIPNARIIDQQPAALPEPKANGTNGHSPMPESHLCAECIRQGKPSTITEIKIRGGESIPAAEVAARTLKDYGEKLCYQHSKEAKARREREEEEPIGAEPMPF